MSQYINLIHVIGLIQQWCLWLWKYVISPANRLLNWFSVTVEKYHKPCIMALYIDG